MIQFFKKEKKEKKFEGKLFESEGQLAIDVYQTEKELVIQSAIAGIKLKDLDISIEKDKLTIRGKREKPAEEGKVNYFYQECYWGPFFREIILPVEVDPSKTNASFKEGILTIRIPKIEREKTKKIEIKEQK
jgi:HSP20 family protein